MSEIPEDVQRAARNAFVAPWHDGEASLVSLVSKDQEDAVKLTIARAILAERRQSVKLIQSLSFAAKAYLIFTKAKHSESHTYKAIEVINKSALEYLAKVGP